MALVARNGLWLTRASPAVETASAVRTSGLIEALATGEMRFASTGDNMYIASLTSNVVIGSFGTPDVITVGSNTVTVNADLQVVGTVQTVHTADLYVQDYVVSVACGALPGDSASTDGAGVIVGAPSNFDGTPDERSVRWRAGQVAGTVASVASAPGGASNGPGWDVRGGWLRLTATVPGSQGGQPWAGAAVDREVSYGFRVNELDEMELFKRTLPSACNNDDGAASYRCVVAFGGSAGATGVPLPKSYNPWVA